MSATRLVCPDCETPVPTTRVQVSGYSQPFLCPGCGEMFPRLALKTVRELRTTLAGALPEPGDVVTLTTRLNGDQTFSSTTPADVVGLKFSVIAGTYYLFRFVIIAQSPTVTTGSQVGLALSVTKPATTVFAADVTGTKMTWDDLSQASANYLATYEGLILPSATGTLQLQAANTFGTGIVTVKQASSAFLTIV